MSTITEEQQQSIRAYLESHILPKGLGNAESACSIAAINLSLTGRLTDEIPECMSRVIGRWIIRIQDAMPDDMRNSHGWKYLLPLAAGTARNPYDENKRKNIILKWMWDIVLPQLQPLADKRGFGEKWKAMTDEKTSSHAYAAADAAYAAADADAADAAAYAAADAADAAADAAYAAADADAADAAAYAAAYAAADAADAAADAAAADAAVSAAAAAIDDFWIKVDPISVLEQLVDV